MENDLKQSALKQNLDQIYDPSDQFEPLPFYDYDLFQEKNGLKNFNVLIFIFD
jgi:hypothetical protein